MSGQADGRHAKLKGLIWIAVVSLIAVLIAAGEPFFIRQIPFRFEERLALKLAQSDDDVCGTKAGDAALEKIIARIYPLNERDRAMPIRTRVVSSEEVNAYAFLGGQITVNDALLREARSPEELAGVIAHEIEHVQRRHVLEGLVVQMGTWGAISWMNGSSNANVARMLMNMQFTKGQEREADEGGLARLVQADVDTKGFADFFARAHDRGGYGYLSDHPSDASRAARALELHRPEAKPVLTKREWHELQTICD